MFIIYMIMTRKNQIILKFSFLTRKTIKLFSMYGLPNYSDLLSISF